MRRSFALLALCLWQIPGLAVTPLATETIAPTEAADTAKVVATLTKQVEDAAKAAGTAHRDAHAKAHGCVHAVFKVQDTLPAWLRHGAFKEGAEYQSWIRFSNGSQQKDSTGDARGLALKLTGVTGDKLETEEKLTQDFLFINHPRFFVRSAADYVDFTAAVARGNPIPFFFPGINPAKWHLTELGIARAIQTKRVDNPLATTYFSSTPYLLGEGQAVKHSIVPVSPVPALTVNRKSDDFLRESMTTHLSLQGVTFEFLVQKQTDGDKMPIEDSTVEWQTKGNEYVKVATIEVPKQEFNSEAQRTFCENLSMNPWHSLSDHRPLGNINRMRRAVYKTISEVRHRLNHEPHNEPTGKERFN